MLENARLIAVGKAASIVVIAVALQTLVVSHVTVLGLTVDLFVIFTVIVATTWGPLSGAVFGFLSGLAADVAYRQPLGMRALVYVLVGYALGVLAGRFRAARPRTIFLYTLGASFAAKVVLGLFSYLMGPRAGFFTMFGLQMIPGAALDALCAVPVFVLLVKLKVVPIPRAEVGAAGEAVQ
jgi:rod shape-determining protein MreD